ncbi:tetratricopeptide repeat protein [Thermogutta terrifontis]|uniref:tetratricopeptide repeat protein n=1 Tax=Thermogutta terrifontis TaxID=1331910 RepID=UPI0012FE16A0|nr:tetratricopeptide repeat protein [Thermogutta terrifontis]
MDRLNPCPRVDGCSITLLGQPRKGPLDMPEPQDQVPQATVEKSPERAERRMPEAVRQKGIRALFGSKWGLLALVIGSVVVVAGLGGLAWWWLTGKPEDGATALFEAVDAQDWPTVHEMAAKALADKRADPELLRAALFAQLVAYTAEADRQTGTERHRMLLLAAQFGDQATIVGLPPGREADGLFTLGRTLHYLSRFAESRKYLREAAKLDSQKQPRVNWLMAESHLLDPEGNRQEALRFNQAFLLTPGLDALSQNAGWLQQARIHLALGSPDAAEESLKHLTPKGVNSSEAYLVRGQIALLRAQKLVQNKESNRKEEFLKYINEARASFERVKSDALGDESARAKAAYLLGVILNLGEDYDGAMAAWERCCSEFPDYPESWAARFQIARLNHRLGRHDRTVDELANCIQKMVDAERFLNPWISKEDIRQTVDQVWLDCLDKKLFSLCLKLANGMEGVFTPELVYSLRAKTYIAWGEYLESSKPEDGTTEDNKALARRYFRLAGDDLTRLARFRAATRFYTEDLWQAADYYYRGGSYTRASRVLREYLRNEARRRNPQALLRLGECLLAMGKPDDALRVLYECIEFHSKDAASYKARLWAAYAHMEKGEYDKAEAVLVENLAGELAPTSLEWRDSLFTVGTLYFRLGRDREALEKLEEAVRRYPQDRRVPEARYFLAELYLRAAVAKASSQPNIPAMQSALTRDLLQSALEELQVIQKELDSQWDRGGTTPATQKLLRNVYFALGDVLYRLGRFGDAINTYVTLTNRLQSEPEVLDAYMQMARCYRAMGRTREAQTTLQQAKIMLNRLPPDVALEKSTPFSREEWQARLAWLERHL